jgi:hypothetical protein
VQDECDTLGGGEGVQHDLQSHPDRVGEQRFVLRVFAGCRGDERLGHERGDGLLGTGRACSDHVQTDPCDDRGEPAGEVVDLAGAGPLQA